MDHILKSNLYLQTPVGQLISITAPDQITGVIMEWNLWRYEGDNPSAFYWGDNWCHLCCVISSKNSQRFSVRIILSQQNNDFIFSSQFCLVYPTDFVCERNRFKSIFSSSLVGFSAFFILISRLRENFIMKMMHSS